MEAVLYPVLVAVAVAFAVTGVVAAAVTIGPVGNVVKTVTYFLYERFRDRIAGGVGA